LFHHVCLGGGLGLPGGIRLVQVGGGKLGWLGGGGLGWLGAVGMGWLGGHRLGWLDGGGLGWLGGCWLGWLSSGWLSGGGLGWLGGCWLGLLGSGWLGWLAGSGLGWLGGSELGKHGEAAAAAGQQLVDRLQGLQSLFWPHLETETALASGHSVHYSICNFSILIFDHFTGQFFYMTTFCIAFYQSNLSTFGTLPGQAFYHKWPLRRGAGSHLVLKLLH
jgi:hypothetical protein